MSTFGRMWITQAATAAALALAALLPCTAALQAASAATLVEGGFAPGANQRGVRSGSLDRRGSFDRNHDRLSDYLAERLDRGGPGDLVDVIVTFRQPRSAATTRAEIGAFTVDREFTIVNGFSATMTAGQIRALAASSSVFRIDENFEVHAVLDAANADTGALDARADFGVDGSGVTICITDTGLDATHEQFDTNPVGPGEFFDAINGQAAPYDDHYHGTHVAGIAAGDGTGALPFGPQFGGFAPGAQLVVAKVLNSSGSGTAAQVIAGIEWCAGRPDVNIISMSLGGGPTDGQDVLSQAVNCASDPSWPGTCGAIGGTPKIVVVAAGNAGAEPSTVGTPGTAERAITVGSFAEWSASITANWHDDGVYLNPFSSRGPVLAGNGSVLYVKPDITGPGSRIAAAGANTGGTGYFVLSGTSMATPAISGIVALMIDADPGMGGGVELPAEAIVGSDDPGVTRLPGRGAVDRPRARNSSGADRFGAQHAGRRPARRPRPHRHFREMRRTPRRSSGHRIVRYSRQPKSLANSC